MPEVAKIILIVLFLGPIMLALSVLTIAFVIGFMVKCAERYEDMRYDRRMEEESQAAKKNIQEQKAFDKAFRENAKKHLHKGKEVH